MLTRPVLRKKNRFIQNVHVRRDFAATDILCGSFQGVGVWIVNFTLPYWSG